MNKFYKTFLFVMLTAVILIQPNLNGATRVIDHSRLSGTLQAKWNHSLDKAFSQNKSFWLAFSVDKLMAENEYFISSLRITGHITTSSFSSTFSGSKGISLGKLIYGRDIDIIKPIEKNEKIQIKEAAKEALANIKNKGKRRILKKVKKEVALLFFFESRSGKAPSKVRYTNMFFPFENKGMPIYWLGKTDENRSFHFLTGIFANLKEDKAKRSVLSAIGYYSDSNQVIPFLVKVLNSDESDKVRGKAAGELGDQDNPKAVNILLNTAKNDYSLEVRRKSVNALEDLEFPASVDALIDIAKNANNTYIREKAINTLGDIGSKKAAEALNEIAFKDNDIKLQRRAVNAFEDLPKNGGISYLINIAKTHPKPYIRKKALNCLSDFKDPRAFEAIKSIAEGKK